MNDEELVSKDECQTTLSPDDPPAPQDAEKGGAGETETAEIADLALPRAGDGESEAPSPEDPATDSAISDDSVPDSDSLPAADPDADQEESLEHLRDELRRLREEIATRDDFYSRIGRDYEEFRTLYPNVSISDLPDNVWADVKCGIPIAAAYALAEQRTRIRLAQAESVNLANAARSSGALQATEPEFFTSDEVRAMSRDEVRHNYQKILRSMKKWN